MDMIQGYSNVHRHCAAAVFGVQYAITHTPILRFRLAAPREQSLGYAASEVTPHVFSLGKPLCTRTAEAFWVSDKAAESLWMSVMWMLTQINARS